MGLCAESPAPSADRNLDRLGNVFVALEARLSADQRLGIDSELRRALYAGRNLTLTTRIGDLDIVQRRPGITSGPELVAASEQTTHRMAG